jgi:hypothetical protein
MEKVTKTQENFFINTKKTVDSPWAASPASPATHTLTSMADN